MRILAGQDTAFDGDILLRRRHKNRISATRTRVGCGNSRGERGRRLAAIKAEIAEFEQISVDMGNPDADIDQLMKHNDSIAR